MEIDNNEITIQDPMETDPEPIQADPEPVSNVVSVSELLPAIRDVGSEVALRLEDNLPQLLTESVQEVIEGDGSSDRPFMTTEFNDYTVTEGLLLIITVILIFNFFLTILRRWF